VAPVGRHLQYSPAAAKKIIALRRVNDFSKKQARKKPALSDRRTGKGGLFFKFSCFRS
jgi:hypothetical protein